VLGNDDVKSVERRLVLRFLQEVLGQRRLDVLPQLFSPDVLDHRPAGIVSGLEALKLGLTRFLSAFPDLTLTIHGLAVEPPVAMAWLTWQGTPVDRCLWLMGRTRRGAKLTVGSVAVFLARAGLLAERWEFLDPSAPRMAHSHEQPVSWSQFVPGDRPLLSLRW
jgi:hypothetical protein